MRIQGSIFIETENFLLFWMERCTPTTKPKTLFTTQQRLQFILFCARKWILNQIVVIGSRRPYLSKNWCTSLIKRIPSSMLVLIAVKFSTPELLQKSHRTTENEKFFPDPVENTTSCETTIILTVQLTWSTTLILF